MTEVIQYPTNVEVFRVTLLAFDDCVASSLFGFADLFDAANRALASGGLETRFDVAIASPGGRDIRAFNGTRINCVDADVTDPAIVLIPGIGVTHAEQLPESLENLRPVIDWVENRFNRQSVFGAGCTGPFILAEAGVLSGSEVTVSWWAADLFRSRYPEISLADDNILVRCDNLMTAGAGAAHYNLSLALIYQFAGRSIARLCAQRMLIEGNGAPQSAHAVPVWLGAVDSFLAKVELSVARLSPHKIKLADIAKDLKMSERTLGRRIRTRTGLRAQEYVNSIRLQRAKHLLEISENVDQIASDLGYSDRSAFGRAFKKFSGLSPADYRNSFSNPIWERM